MQSRALQVAQRKRRIKQRFMEFATTFFMYNPCQDCGEADPTVLEFDHVRGTKRQNVSFMIKEGYGWDTIMAEIAKCEIVCCNCHRRRTAKTQKHARWTFFKV